MPSCDSMLLERLCQVYPGRVMGQKVPSDILPLYTMMDS